MKTFLVSLLLFAASTLFAADLPSWTTKPLADNADHVFVVGVSQPFPDREMAASMAFSECQKQLAKKLGTIKVTEKNGRRTESSDWVMDPKRVKRLEQFLEDTTTLNGKSKAVRAWVLVRYALKEEPKKAVSPKK